MLGDHLFPLVQRVEPLLAGKITGMLLELDCDELRGMIESPEALNTRIVEAVSVLYMPLDDSEADATQAQPHGHAAPAVGPLLRPPLPDALEGLSRVESVAVPSGMPIPLPPRPLNGGIDPVTSSCGIVPVNKPPILPKHASARPVRRQEVDSTAHRHVQEVDSSDDEKGRASSLPAKSLPEQPGRRPDPPAEGQQPPESLGVTNVQPCEGTGRETAAALPPPVADDEAAYEVDFTESEEDRLRRKKERKNARAKLLRAAKRAALSLAPAPAANADPVSDNIAPPNASAAASLPVASQPDGDSDPREVRLRRPDNPSPLVTPMPGSVEAHGRSLPAAFSAAKATAASYGPAGVPAALHARVASGPVEDAPANRLKTPPPDLTQEGAGNLTPDPVYPPGTYALVKTTSQSQSSKGRIMLVESSKDGEYHLSHISETAPKKKTKIRERFLQPIDRSAENIVQYDNLRVHNPTLPAAPPAPLELSTVPDAPPPTPNTAVPEQQNLNLASLVSSRLSLGSGRHSRPHSILSGDRAEPPSLQPAAVQTPAPRRASTTSTSVASTSSASSQLSAVPPVPARPEVLHVPAKRPPSKMMKDTTLSPLDEQFQPPVAGSVFYRLQGVLHVIITPGVELPASYDKVIVETAEEAVAIHVAARAAAAAASNVAAAMSRLEAKTHLSSLNGMQQALDDPTPGNTRMQIVLPKSLTSRREQALAIQAIADLESEIDLAQRERMVGDAEAANLLDRLEESNRANEALSAELASERGRCEMSEARAEDLTARHREPSLPGNQHLAEWALQQKEFLDSADVSNQLIADLQRRLALAQERERETTPQHVASLERAVAQWTEAYGALQAGSEDALLAERKASDEIITGYLSAKEDLAAEYRDLEAQLAEALEERQAERVTNEEILTSYRDANASNVAEYQSLETHAGQLEDKLAAAEVRLQLRSTDEETTPQEPWLALQAERVQHESINNFD